MTLSRRNFLLGAAATAVASQLPAAVPDGLYEK